MGWESRDWAKWSEEERGRHLAAGGPTPPVDHVRSSHRGRVLVWSSLGLLILVLLLGAWVARASVDESAPDLSYEPQAEINHVIYGWRHVPPRGVPNLDPSRMGDRIAGMAVLCTKREPAAEGRYVCDEYSAVYPGWKVVVLSESFPSNEAPCRRDMGPGGRVSPCPMPAEPSVPGTRA